MLKKHWRKRNDLRVEEPNFMDPVALLAHPLQAEIVPAPLFRDGAVLQRDKPVPVWGRTEAGGKVTVTFAGPDGFYHPAAATISADGTSLLLTSAEVAKSARARFAWSSVAEPNLVNRAGLPAAAINTHWPKNLKPGEKP